MRLTMNGKNLEITDGMLNYLEKKLNYFDKFLSKDSVVIANCSKRKNIRKLEVYFNYENTDVKAKSEGEDFYVIVDDILDTLKNKMSKLHSLKVKKTRTSIRPIYDEDLESVDEDTTYIMKRKQFSLKPMSEEEAILQMNLLGHHSFIFRNADLKDIICMVYRRIDNKYGIIETI